MLQSAVVIVIYDGSLHKVTRFYDELRSSRVERAAGLEFAKEIFAAGLDPTVEELQAYIADGVAEWNDRLILLAWPGDVNSYEFLRGSTCEKAPRSAQEHCEMLERVVKQFKTQNQEEE